jgi:integrase
MAGQLIRRGDHTWMVRVPRGKSPEGKRLYHNKTVKGSKKDAQRYLTKALADHDAGCFVEPSRSTLGSYLAHWLEASVKPRVREKTFEDYEFHVRRYIAPAIGGFKLSELQPSSIQKFYNGLSASGLSSRTVRYVHSTLRSALQQAVKWGELTRNVADLVELPRQARAERKVLTAAQTNALIDGAEGNRWKALWVLLVTTGLRPGEALGLKWSDLDGDALRVQRSLVLLERGWRLEETKTDRSRRSVPLLQVTLKVLEAHRMVQVKEAQAAGARYNREMNLVFANSYGEPVDFRTTVRRYFKPLLKSLGLPEIRPYDLRHTHATLLLAAGVHPKIVSERLGHSSTVMTMDVYSHVLPTMQEAAMEKLHGLLVGTAESQIEVRPGKN